LIEFFCSENFNISENNMIAEKQSWSHHWAGMKGMRRTQYQDQAGMFKSPKSKPTLLPTYLPTYRWSPLATSSPPSPFLEVRSFHPLQIITHSAFIICDMSK
jgi:hypothetical protein